MKKSAQLEKNAALRQRRAGTSRQQQPHASVLPSREKGRLAEKDGMREEVARLRDEAAGLRAKRDWLREERERLFPHSAAPADNLDLESKDLAHTFSQLQSSCLRYAHLFDGAPVGDAILSSNGRIQEINHTGAQMLGMHRAHLMGQFLSGFVLREDYPKILRHLRSCQAGQTRVHAELRLKRRGGPPLPVELISVPFRDPRDNYTYFRTAIIDITPRRRAESAVDRVQQDYQTLINSIEGLVWEGRAQDGSLPWRFTFVSNQAEQLLGYSAQRWLLEPEFWENHLHPADRSKAIEARAHALSNGKNHLLEYRMIDAQRRTIWVRDSVTVQTEPGQVKLRGLLINISELKEMEESLRRAHEQLEVRVEHRTAALARTCIELQHEINERKRLEHELLELTDHGRRQQGVDVHGEVGQSLAGIALMLKGLEEKLEETSPKEANLAERIQFLVDQTMAQTRDPVQELGSFRRREETLPEALKGLAARAETAFEVPCRLKPNGQIPPIDSDVIIQFYNIAQEAIVNAVKFAEAGRVVLSLTGKGGRLVLTVQHDGHPFPTPLHHSLELGLKIMTYRAKLIGAALQVSEKGDQGPVVTCVFPAKGKKRESVVSGQ